MRKRAGAAGRLLRRGLAALLVFALLGCASPLGVCSEEGTNYIVKYRQSGAEAAESVSARYGVVSGEELRRLLLADAVEWYEPDGEALLLGGASPYYGDAQWNLEMIGADAAFREGVLGRGVRVGVLDSGVSPHPDLAACLLPGHNYIPDAPDPDDTRDTYGHGTRVAGLIAGTGEDGYIGVAPGAGIVPLKITDGKSVLISTLCAAIYGAIDDYGCTVLNLSLGVRTEYAALREAVAYAEEKNVLVVAAAGNNGNDVLYFPAAYDSVIGVGAVAGSGEVYAWSNHNAGVMLAAPGAEVRSTAYLGGYALSTGTSFSVPQVCGAAAVMRGMDGSLTCAELRDILAATASDRGEPGWDEYYGYGILNLAGCVAAVEKRMAEAALPLTLLPETGAASAVRNGGGEELSCVYCLAYYGENGGLLRVLCLPVAVPAGETVELPPPEEGLSFGQFLWEADTLRPLAAARRADPAP